MNNATYSGARRHHDTPHQTALLRAMTLRGAAQDYTTGMRDAALGLPEQQRGWAYCNGWDDGSELAAALRCLYCPTVAPSYPLLAPRTSWVCADCDEAAVWAGDMADAASL